MSIDRERYRDQERILDKQRFIPHDLPDRQVQILNHLHKAKVLTTVMLSKILGITQQKVQRSMQSLEIRGLVRRVQYQDGTRAYNVLNFKPHENHRIYGLLYTRVITECPGWQAQYIPESRYIKDHIVIIKPSGESISCIVPRTYAEKIDIYIVKEELKENITTTGQKYIVYENLWDYNVPFSSLVRAKTIKRGV